MFETAFIRLKWRCQQGCVPSRGSQKESFSLPFLASRGHLHSLFVAPPSSKCLKISMLLTSHLFLLLWLFYLPFIKDSRDYIWIIHLDNFFISRSLFIHLYKIPFWPCKVMYLQVLRIMMWTSLGDSLYSAYFIMVEWITIPCLHSYPQNRISISISFCSNFALSSHLWLRSISPPLGSGTDHVTFFGQWDLSSCDLVKGLKSTYVSGHALLCLCHCYKKNVPKTDSSAVELNSSSRTQPR